MGAVEAAPGVGARARTYTIIINISPQHSHSSFDILDGTRCFAQLYMTHIGTKHERQAMQTPLYSNAPAQRSSSRRILVIDADASGRRTICTCIAELGHEAIAAAAADEDWLIAALSEVDMIVANCGDHVSCKLLAQLHAKVPEIPTLMLSTPAQCPETIPENTILLAKAVTLETLERAIAATGSRRSVEPRSGSFCHAARASHA